MKIGQTKFKETEIGPLPEEWDVFSVEKIGRVVTGKTPPTNTRDYYGNDYPFVKIPDMNGSVCITKTGSMISEKGAKYLGKAKLPKNSVMVSCIATVGNVAITSQESFTNQQINSIIPNQEIIDPLYLYYFFKNNKEYIESLGGGGSVYTNISKSKFENMPVVVPELIEQKRIAGILGELDEKIELNRRMNDTLEKIASAIFKHWFVDFDFPFDFAQGRPDEQGKPYKSTGGKMIESELGLIPIGWEISNLRGILQLNYGKALKAEVRNDGNIKVYGSSGFVGFHNEKIATGPGIVIGRKGNVGSVYWVDSDFYPIDTTYFVESKLPLVFCYYLLKNQNFINGDSVVPGLNREQAYLNQIILPDLKVIEMFGKPILEIRNTISFIEKQNNIFSQIRDSLLPRLMSGKIRVDRVLRVI